jgi:hypothetical protein
VVKVSHNLSVSKLNGLGLCMIYFLVLLLYMHFRSMVVDMLWKYSSQLDMLDSKVNRDKIADVYK